MEQDLEKILGIRYLTAQHSYQKANCSFISLLTGENKVLDQTKSKVSNRDLISVPIIRIFGPTTNGHHGCLVIHDIYPYFYVDWPEKLNSILDFKRHTCFDSFHNPAHPDENTCSTFTIKNQITSSTVPSEISGNCKNRTKKRPFNLENFELLDLNAFFVILSDFLDARLYEMQEAKNLKKDFKRKSSVFVYDIHLVYRRSLYGFNKHRKPFIQIKLLNWQDIHNAATILHKREFYGIQFQPFEAHLVGLQFLADYNIQGSDYVWITENSICHSDYSSNLICDTPPMHVKATDILNQYLTPLRPHFNSKPDLSDVSNDPSDFSHSDAPSISAAFESIWQEERLRCEKLNLGAIQKLDDREKKLSRIVKNYMQMIEIRGQNILQQILTNPFKLPINMYSSEYQLRALNINKKALEIDTKHTKTLHWSIIDDVDNSVLVFERKNRVDWLKSQCHKETNNQIPLRIINSYLKSSISNALYLYTERLPKLRKQKPKSKKLHLYSSCSLSDNIHKMSLEFGGRLLVQFHSKSNQISTSQSSMVDNSNNSANFVPASSSSFKELENNECYVDMIANQSPQANGSDEYVNFTQTSESIQQPSTVSKNTSNSPSSYLEFLHQVRKKKKIIPKASVTATSQDTLISFSPSHSISVKKPSSGTQIYDKYKYILQKQSMFGYKYGRCLGFEVVVNVLDKQPISFWELKRTIPDYEMSAIMGIVYICRLEVTSDISWERQREIIAKHVKHTDLISVDKAGYIDIHGCVSVEPNNDTWLPGEVIITKESFRYQSKIIDPLLQPAFVQWIVPTEKDLILWTIHNLFRIFDPSIIYGIDTQYQSIGFFKQRAKFLGLQAINNALSRCPFKKMVIEQTASPRKKNNILNLHLPTQIDDTLTGRLVVNIKSLIRKEVKTAQDTVFHLIHSILNVKLPNYSLYILSEWWKYHGFQNVYTLRHKTVVYISKLLHVGIKLTDTLNILEQSSEVARLLGTDLHSAMTRGEQHRVESLLIRSAHALDYLLPTASKEQVKNQPPVMALPLVLEPNSSFYWSPVVVLDFQALYPSIIAAYNICYSTCLGQYRYLENIDEHGQPWKQLGIFKVYSTKNYINYLQNENAKSSDELCIFVAANDTLFVTPSIRRGILPSLMEEVLSLRLATKDIETKLSQNKAFFNVKRLLKHRQYALKMFSNCTYGYCGANMTGRMPCAEIADAIVQTARRTLERAIAYIESNPRWQAKVVYGDTDSLFIHLENRTLEQAFTIGREMVEQITALNPPPLKLKLEKVYLPCCLQTKKRYVGYSYVSEKAKPKLDSKGIETIRRDQCTAVSRTLRKTLLSLFRTSDVSKLKETLLENFSKLMIGEPYVCFEDFIFYRELRLDSYAYTTKNRSAHTLPPQALVSYSMINDWYQEKKNEVKAHQLFGYKSRVPYIVVLGNAKSRLLDLVVHPYREKSVFSPITPITPSDSKNSHLTYPKLLISFQLFLRCYRPRNIYTVFSKKESALVLKNDWYLTKQILPVLKRILVLLNPKIDLDSWVFSIKKTNLVFERSTDAVSMDRRDLSKKMSFFEAKNQFTTSTLNTMHKFFPTMRLCLCCGIEMHEKCISNYCDQCKQNPQSNYLQISYKINYLQRRLALLNRLCVHCAGNQFLADACNDAFYCRVFPKKIRCRQQIEDLNYDIEDIFKK